MPTINKLPLVALVLGIGVASPAAAQQTCAPREAITTELTHSLGQLPQMMGLGDNGLIYEWWADQAGNWTVTMQMPNARLCVIQRGQAFVRLDPKFGEPA